MTKTFAVNQDNDIYIGADGNLALVYDLTAVLQTCERVCKIRLGEMVLDTNLGIPFFSSVWGGTKSLQQFEAAIRQAIGGVPGVTRVLELVTEIKADVLIYTVFILTAYGRGSIQDSVGLQ